MTSCLLVDDSTTIRKIIRKMLEEMNFECSEADNGKNALDACQQEMPDAIILDWNMPVMTGIEFLRLVRKLPGGDHPKIVLCTTNSEIDHITEALTDGADEYIIKPFNSDIVRSKFEQIGLL